MKPHHKEITLSVLVYTVKMLVKAAKKETAKDDAGSCEGSVLHLI
jgi:hypothetical protein